MFPTFCRSEYAWHKIKFYGRDPAIPCANICYLRCGFVSCLKLFVYLVWAHHVHWGRNQRGLKQNLNKSSFQINYQNIIMEKAGGEFFHVPNPSSIWKHAYFSLSDWHEKYKDKQVEVFKHCWIMKRLDLSVYLRSQFDLHSCSILLINFRTNITQTHHDF